MFLCLNDCAIRSADMIRELESLDPEIRDVGGQSPLHVAATMPHSAALRAMLDVFYSSSRGEHRRYNINHVNSVGDSALHVCCVEGDADKVRLMLDRGADLEKRGSKSYTLLHRLVKVLHCARATFVLRFLSPDVYSSHGRSQDFNLTVAG